MSDHIFSATVKGRIADTRASMNKAYDAHARLQDQEGGYAKEILAVAQLHQRVLVIWTAALEGYNEREAQRCETGVLAEVKTERQRQDAKWGEQNHDPFAYLAILTEEVGEAAQAAVQARFEGGDPARFRHEIVQVAAVAVAIVECVDRGLWAWARMEP
jgi:NTP pyrophosphatase (non-canonical NTP hydrolase)